MNKRDIASNINFFMNVPVTPEGRLTFEDGISAPGKYVEMRAETDVLVLIRTARNSTIPATPTTPRRCACSSGIRRPSPNAVQKSARTPGRQIRTLNNPDPGVLASWRFFI